MKSKKRAPKARFHPIYDSLNMQWIDVWTLAESESPTPNGMPTEVTIYGQKFRVKYRKEIYNAPRRKSRLAGVVIYANRLIIIDPDATLHEMREVLYHEVGHVYLKTAQMEDKRLCRITAEETEGICDMIGKAVVDLASNNPLPR